MAYPAGRHRTPPASVSRFPTGNKFVLTPLDLIGRPARSVVSAAPGAQEMERRLAAIVCADIAGYSRMMGADEEGTHATFKAHRTAIHPIILNHGGRLVKNTGDGFLLEFPSIVGAIEAAIEIQEITAERNNHIPVERLMQFRLGIHMGDVMADEDEVFGDDVNIAVRLESVAVPGVVAISAKAHGEAGKHRHYRCVRSPHQEH